MNSTLDDKKMSKEGDSAPKTLNDAFAELTNASLPEGLNTVLKNIQENIKQSETVIAKSLDTTFELFKTAAEILAKNEHFTSENNLANTDSSSVNPLPAENTTADQQQIQKSSDEATQQIAYAQQQTQTALAAMANSSAVASAPQMQSAIDAVAQAIQQTSLSINSGIQRKNEALAHLLAAQQQLTPQGQPLSTEGQSTPEPGNQPLSTDHQ